MLLSYLERALFTHNIKAFFTLRSAYKDKDNRCLSDGRKTGEEGMSGHMRRLSVCAVRACGRGAGKGRRGVWGSHFLVLSYRQS